MSSVDSLAEQQLVDQFLASLRAVPGAHAESNERTSGAAGWPCDASIDLCVGEKATNLFVEVKKTLYPRDVREVLWQRRKLLHGTRAESDASALVLVLVAESISPGAKEILQQERVGYFDSGGSLFLSAEDFYIYVAKPPSKRFARSIRSLFSGRRALVLLTLLKHHTNWFSVHGLAKEAGVSPATASEVLIELERIEWVVSGGRGPAKRRQLDEPGKLLDAWAEQLRNMRPPPTRRYYVPLIQADELIQKLAAVLAAHGVEYAITGEAAGQHYAPFLSSLSRIHCRLRLGPAVDEALAKLGARAVDQGANLVAIDSLSPGDSFLYRDEHGTQFARPIPVYLDLMRSGGRARDLAEHLRSEVIGF